MIDSYKDLQDVLSVAGFTQNGLQAIDHRGEETRPLQQGRLALFDGVNDYGVSGVSTTFETATNQFSMVCDLQLTSASGVVFNKVLAAGGWDSYMFRLIATNTMQIVFTNGTNFVGFNIPVANLATTFNRIVLRWACTAGTASDCRAWVNGTEVSVTIGTSSGYTSAFLITYINSPLSVGARRSTTGTFAEYVAGSLANLFVWNTALSVADCIRLSDRTKPILQLPNIGNLMFGYKFDEGDGILAINCLGIGGVTDLTLSNIIPINFHQQRTNGFGSDWQNQFGFTPSVRFNAITNTSGINLGNGANAQIVQHQAFTFHTWINLPSATGKAILSNYANGGNATQFQFGTGGTNLQLFIPNIGYVYNGADNIIANTWFHIAWVRENTGTNGCKMYVNGNFRGRFTYANTTIPTSVMYIGTDILNAVGYTFNGRMQNICFVPSAIWTEGGSTTIGTNVFTPPTTWLQYQALEATNPSKLAIYTQNIVNNPLSVPITFVDSTSLLIPRNENNTSLDALGRPLFFRNRAKYNLALRQSNALTFDLTNDFVQLPNPPLIGTSDYRLEISFVASAIGGNRNLVYIGNGTNFIRVRIRQATGSINIDHAGFNTGNILDVVIGTFYTLVLIKTGNDATVTMNGVQIYRNTGSFTGSVANQTHALGTNVTLNNDPFGNTMLNYKLRVAGVDFCDFPMQEGGGTRIYSRINGHVGTLNNFAFPTAWQTRQDAIHSNLLQGFEEYTDGVGGLIRVPLSNLGTSLGVTIAGFTSQGIRAAGTWHNNSEVVVRQPLVPSLIRLDILNTFYTAGVANNLTFANLPNNVGNLGKITCKTSVSNRRSNLKTYRGFN